MLYQLIIDDPMSGCGGFNASALSRFIDVWLAKS
jgi:hypothetical protein